MTIDKKSSDTIKQSLVGLIRVHLILKKGSLVVSHLEVALNLTIHESRRRQKLLFHSFRGELFGKRIC